jgi:hypothetical protein
MRMPEPACPECKEEELVQTKPIAEQITPLVQRLVEEEEKEEELLQTKSDTGRIPEVTPGFASRIQSIRGGGRPLPHSERAFFEPRFGQDFSGVRIHTDRQVAEAARAVNSRAFTTGRDVVFGAGQYAPGTTEGRKLLGHELTHVVQQTNEAGSCCKAARSSKAAFNFIQGYWLRDFPKAKKSLMTSAISTARSVVKSCDYPSWLGKRNIRYALATSLYIYIPRLKSCGWTVPSSPYILVGGKAFNENKCCKLASTLAHEAAHIAWYTEGMAEKLECECFGCC